MDNRAQFTSNSKIQSNNQEILPVLDQDSQKYPTDPEIEQFIEIANTSEE